MALLSLCLTWISTLARPAIAALALGASVLIGPSFAADLPRRSAPPPIAVSQSNPFLAEVRLGVFAHDPWSPEEGSVDINGEILFGKPFTHPDPLINFFIPRPHVGGTVSTVGDTSHAYVGLTWSYDITSAIFVEASFGGGVNNGESGVIVPADRVAIGCNWNFRESASIGYRFNKNWSIMGTVEHISNAGLCNQNRGLTNAGVRLGYSF